MMPRRVVIGLPSLNEVATIASVTRTLDRAAATLKGVECVLCNADSASQDGTADVFRRTPTQTQKASIVSRATERGKGRNVLAILDLAARSKAACMLFDTDVTSGTSEWLYAYAEALASGYDFIVPIYRRAKHAASVTNTTLYPLVKGVLGADIRQPIGGEFGLSREFVSIVLQQRSVMDPALDLNGFGIDSFLTCTALESAAKICGVHLGAKVHRIKDPARDLETIFTDEVLVAFDFIARNAAQLGSERLIPKMGEACSGAIPHPDLNCEQLARTARTRYKAHLPKMRVWFSDNLLHRLHGIFDDVAPPCLFNHERIAVLFEAIAAFAHARGIPDVRKRRTAFREIGAALYPFYLARMIDLVRETAPLEDDIAEQVFRSYAAEMRDRRFELLERLDGWTVRSYSVM